MQQSTPRRACRRPRRAAHSTTHQCKADSIRKPHVSQRSYAVRITGLMRHDGPPGQHSMLRSSESRGKRVTPWGKAMASSRYFAAAALCAMLFAGNDPHARGSLATTPGTVLGAGWRRAATWSWLSL